MKKTLRKLTAMALVVSMVTSTVAMVPAFAASTNSKDQIKTLDDSSSYAYYQQDGTVVTTDDAGLAYESATLRIDDTAANSDAYVELSKTIEGTSTENEFKITLEVITTEDIDDLGVSPDAAVVLVFDNSISMSWDTDGNTVAYYTPGTGDYTAYSTDTVAFTSANGTGYWDRYSSLDAANSANAGNVSSVYTLTTSTTTSVTTNETYYYVYVADGTGDYNMYDSYDNGTMDFIPTTGKGDWTIPDTSRMAQAKEAATDFITSFATSAYDCTRMVSVVEFSKTATTVQNWTNVANNSGLDDVTDAIDDIDVSTLGGTNIQDGLSDAYTLINQTSELKNDDGDAITAVYVVLLSDGAPTLSGSDGGDSSSTDEATYTSAQTMATNIKNEGATLYTVAFAEGNTSTNYNGMTVSTWLKTCIASGASTHVDAASGGELSLGLEDIMNTIKRLATAWEVTDPMGLNISLKENSKTATGYDISGSSNVSVNSETETITWNLKSDVVTSKDGKYTYTLEYTIVLDTDASTFTEGTYYLTNGQTTLEYCFSSDLEDVSEDTNPTVDFLVPAVTGDYPIYSYDVNHWVEVDQGTKGAELINGKYYTLEDDATYEVAKYTEVTESEMGFDADYYYNAGKSEVTEVIDTKGEVINFYYNRIPTTVTVYHIYETTTYSDENPEGIVTTSTDIVSGAGYVGQEFEANATSSEYNGGFEVYNSYIQQGLHTVQKNGKDSFEFELKAQVYADLDEDGSDEATYNIVYFYYEKTIESREVEITVQHHYTEYGWELNKDGQWEEVVVNEFDGNDDYSKQSYGTQYTVALDSDSYEGYESLDSNNKLTGVYNLTKSSTTVTLEYEKHIDNPNIEVDVIVNHIYQVETITIDENGDKVTSNPTTENTVIETVTGYREGETFEADIDEVDSDKKYDYQKKLSDDLVIESLADEGNEITIYYLRTDDQRQKTTVTVYHDYTWIYGDIDEDGEYITVRDDMEKLDWNDTYSLDVDDTQLYAGQFYTAVPESKGYEIQTAEDKWTIELVKDEDDNVITIKYLLEEDLDAADVIVNHYYKTYTETYINGVISVNKGFYTLGETVDYEGHEGERYTAEYITEYDGNDDYQVVTNTTMTVTLGEATKTISIFYFRTEQSFVETEAVVNHHFVTTVSYIDEDGNKATDTDTDSVYGEYTNVNAAEETLYAGMAFYAVEDANLDGREGFTAATSNVTSMFLNEDKEENVIDLYYHASYDEKGDPVTVTVYHHYDVYNNEIEGSESIRTLDEDASSIVEAPVYGTYYAGQYYTGAEITLNGFELISADDDYNNKFLVEGENEIHIYYEKENNEPVETTLDVIHVYTTYYKTGADKLVETDDTAPQITSYVGATYPVTLITKGIFEVDDAEADNNQTIVLTDDSCSIVLDEETNTLTIYYERTEDEIEVDIPDEDIPLTETPQTGDDRNLPFLAMIAILSAAGLAFLVKQELDDKKKRSAN